MRIETVYRKESILELALGLGAESVHDAKVEMDGSTGIYRIKLLKGKNTLLGYKQKWCYWEVCFPGGDPYPWYSKDLNEVEKHFRDICRIYGLTSGDGKSSEKMQPRLTQDSLKLIKHMRVG